MHSKGAAEPVRIGFSANCSFGDYLEVSTVSSLLFASTRTGTISSLVTEEHATEDLADILIYPLLAESGLLSADDYAGIES